MRNENRRMGSGKQSVKFRDDVISAAHRDECASDDG